MFAAIAAVATILGFSWKVVATPPSEPLALRYAVDEIDAYVSDPAIRLTLTERVLNTDEPFVELYARVVVPRSGRVATPSGEVLIRTDDDFSVSASLQSIDVDRQVAVYQQPAQYNRITEHLYGFDATELEQAERSAGPDGVELGVFRLDDAASVITRGSFFAVLPEINTSAEGGDGQPAYLSEYNTNSSALTYVEDPVLTKPPNLADPTPAQDANPADYHAERGRALALFWQPAYLTTKAVLRGVGYQLGGYQYDPVPTGTLDGNDFVW